VSLSFFLAAIVVVSSLFLFYSLPAAEGPKRVQGRVLHFIVHLYVPSPSQLPFPVQPLQIDTLSGYRDQTAQVPAEK